jgi:Ca2+/Na+ antiporter
VIYSATVESAATEVSTGVSAGAAFSSAESSVAFTVVSAGASAGATVSTGATDETLAILLLANTLLTDTITIAAIAANTNFFIIFYFFNCEYYVYYFFHELPYLHCCLFASSLSNITICVPKDDEKV